MKILLVNNHTVHIKELSAALKGHEVEIQQYSPGLKFNSQDKDLIILSGGGGEGLEIKDEYKPGRLWYEDQMNFVKNTDRPVLGICMGFEVISRAFGATVEKLEKGFDNFAWIQTTAQGRERFGRTRLKQYEAHDWCVPVAPKGFKVLAKSKAGIEIIQHKTRPIFATQFHPEKGGTMTLTRLLSSIA